MCACACVCLSFDGFRASPRFVVNMGLVNVAYVAVLCFCGSVFARWKGGSVNLCICRGCIICVFGTKCIGVVRFPMGNVLGECAYTWGLWRGVVCMSLCV